MLRKKSPRQVHFKDGVLTTYIIISQEKNIWFRMTLFFILHCHTSTEPHTWTTHFVGVFGTASWIKHQNHFFKTQKAEGFWQSSRIISYSHIRNYAMVLSIVLGAQQCERIFKWLRRFDMSKENVKRKFQNFVFSMKDYWWIWCYGWLL